MKRPEIVDTTLRDGEQSAGLVFSSDEVEAIALALDRAGVRWIEAGTPAMGSEEQKTMRKLLSLPLRATPIAWNRAVKSDILASIDCGFSYVHVSLPVSDLHIRYTFNRDQNWILEKLEETVRFARSLGCTVLVGAEDASRADPAFFLSFARKAAECGAVRIRYADTVGCLDPFSVYRNLKPIVSACPLPIEFHAHNDFGLADANAVAACRAGASFFSCTISGIGERAGNASMQNPVQILDTCYKLDCGIDCRGLAPIEPLIPSGFVPSPVTANEC